MRWILSMTVLICLLVAVGIIRANSCRHLTLPDIIKKKSNEPDLSKVDVPRLRSFANSIKNYAQLNGCNTGYCFLIDMKRPSGTNRFFIFDLKGDSILDAGLVTHGSGSDKPGGKLEFSNIPGSNASSLGKYKVGKSYMGTFGKAFKLYGLDNTNSNVFNRFVVLHSHPCVPAAAVYPAEICRSWGCPTVAPAYLNVLSKYIEQSEKPVLLSIFY